MRANRYPSPVICLLSAVLATASAVSAANDPERVGWTRLELQASKFFISARSEVELAGRPSAETKAELLTPGEGEGLEPRGAESYRIDIRTRFLSRDSQVRFWFDAADARALQLTTRETSKKRLRHRTDRYTRDGVFSHTLRPNDGEGARPYASWTRVEDKYVAFPPAVGPPVTEPSGLLYIIPAGEFLTPGDRDLVRVFTSGRVREVDVAVIGTERLPVDYVEVSSGGERHVHARVEALHVAVRARAGADDDDFELLGLEGDIDLYIDPRNRTPLLVSGRVQFVGAVRLRLQRVILK